MFYKKNQIKKKVVRKVKILSQNALNKNPEIFRHAKERLKYAYKNKWRVIFSDEISFTKHTNIALEWSSKQRNVEVD